MRETANLEMQTEGKPWECYPSRFPELAVFGESERAAKEAGLVRVGIINSYSRALLQAEVDQMAAA